MKKTTKALAFLLAMAATCTGLAVMPVSAAQIIFGDVNSDGKVSITDVVLLTRCTSDAQFEIRLGNASFHSDTMSAADAATMLRQIVMLDETQGDDEHSTAGVRISEALLTSTLEKGGRRIPAVLSEIEMTDEQTGISTVYSADEIALDGEQFYTFSVPQQEGLKQASKKNITVSLRYRVDAAIMQAEGISFEHGGDSFVGKTYSVQLTTEKKDDSYTYSDAYWLLDSENVIGI